MSLFDTIANIVSAVAAVIAAVVAWRAHRAINKVEVATNSMKDALVASTEKEALARGIKAGIQEEKDRPK